MSDNPLLPNDEDGPGGWVLVGLLLGLGATLGGLAVGSPVLFCAAPFIVAAILLLIPRVRAASVGALLPGLGLVVLGLVTLR